MELTRQTRRGTLLWKMKCPPRSSMKKICLIRLPPDTLQNFWQITRTWQDWCKLFIHVKWQFVLHPSTPGQWVDAKAFPGFFTLYKNKYRLEIR
jgi:hypothetical protein